METETRNIALEVSALTIGYRSKMGNRVIAENLCFRLHTGELTAIIGVNGIGKSTLLRTLGKIQEKLAGQLKINGKDLGDYTPKDLAGQISIVLTGPIASGNMKVIELVALGRQPYTNWIGTLTEDDRSKIASAMAMVQIEDLKYRKCHELSDGQLQRVLIARALAQDTPLILLDEPTTHLDVYHKVQLLKLLQAIAHTAHKTVVFTTHEIELAIQLCDTMLLLDGASNPFGSPRSLLEKKVFESIFPNDMVSFDPGTGTFRIRNSQHPET